MQFAIGKLETILLQVLLLCLLVQLVMYWQTTPQLPLHIGPIPVQTEFLMSEVIDLEGNTGVRHHFQPFRIVNQCEYEIELSIQKPSCTCLGFKKDGVDLSIDQWWSLQSGKECVVGFYALIPIEPKLMENKCLIVARRTNNKAELFRKPLKSKLAVYRDIQAFPSVISIPDLEAKSWEKSVEVTVVNPVDLDCKVPGIIVPELLADTIGYSIVRTSTQKAIGTRLEAYTFLLKFALKEPHTKNP